MRARVPYFRGGSGVNYRFRDLAAAIEITAPELSGKHIFEQLEGLKLRKEFDTGHTPCGLPYSFTDYLEGDYETKSDVRRRA